MKKTLNGFTIAIFIACVAVIAVLLTGTWENFFGANQQEQHSARIIIPQNIAGTDGEADFAGRFSMEENLNTKIPLEEGEVVVSVLTRVGLNPHEEQFVAFRRSTEIAGPIYITLIRFDEAGMGYKRLWSAPTAASQAGTVSLFSMDLVGDRNSSIIITGMNGRNEHTMTVFRQNPQSASDQPFVRIAALQADSPITINEIPRSAAYHHGMANGESFTITAFRHDNDSDNILDQFEITYAFNPASQRFEQDRVARISGLQVEQRRARELLSGRPGVFEGFIHGLWYFTNPAGDTRQYMYFDTVRREIVFFDNIAKQTFHWQRSMPTRQGLYITSQSNSVRTLTRFINIELESLDSIRVRVNENVRIRIMVDSPWNGSYGRAGLRLTEERELPLNPNIDAVFDSPWGSLRFCGSGEYTISSADNFISGRYVFFTINGYRLLELRPEQAFENRGGERNGRMVFRVDTLDENSLLLSRIRIGASGIHDLQEMPVLLTLKEWAGG